MFTKMLKSPFFFLFIAYFYCEAPQKIFRISEGTSMFMPAVEENGLSHRYDFLGDYVITSFSSHLTGVKLGYNGTPSWAAVISKQPIENKPFRIDVRFSIKKGTKADGIAFWLTSTNEFKEGNVYGREPTEGFLVAIDLRGDQPYIGINFNNTEKIANFSRSMKLKENIFDSQLSLRILYENNETVVSVGKNNNFNEVFKVNNYTLPEQSYFVISAKHTTGYSPIRLHAIRHSNIEYPSFRGSPEPERESKRTWVWAVFFIGVAVLVVTIGRKQYYNMQKNQ